MALATEPVTTISDRIAGWKHEIDQSQADALWAIFGYDPADPKGSHRRLTRAWNRGYQPTLNLIAFYEAQITWMEAQGGRIEQALTAAGIDLPTLLRGGYTR